MITYILVWLKKISLVLNSYVCFIIYIYHKFEIRFIIQVKVNICICEILNLTLTQIC